MRHFRTSRTTLIAGFALIRRVCLFVETGLHALGPSRIGGMARHFLRRSEGTMRGYRWFEIALLVAGFIMASGCHSPASRRTVVTPEPSLSGAVDRDAAVADGRTATTPAQTVSWVDRHPLFSKPRDYWETSGENKVVKAAAARSFELTARAGRFASARIRLCALTTSSHAVLGSNSSACFGSEAAVFSLREPT